MKNPIILFFLLLGLTACESGTKQESNATQENDVVKVLAADEFQQKLQEDRNAQLIDVRTAEEYKNGHIPNSQNLDFLNGDFQKGISSLDKEKPVYVYCKSGNRSGKAAAALKEKGFTKVFDLEGGYSAWPFKETEGE